MNDCDAAAASEFRCHGKVTQLLSPYAVDNAACQSFVEHPQNAQHIVMNVIAGELLSGMATGSTNVLDRGRSQGRCGKKIGLLRREYDY